MTASSKGTSGTKPAARPAVHAKPAKAPKVALAQASVMPNPQLGLGIVLPPGRKRGGSAGGGKGAAAPSGPAPRTGNGHDEEAKKPYKLSEWGTPLDRSEFLDVTSLDGKLEEATVARIRERAGRERDPFLVRKFVVDTLLSTEAQQEYLREIKAVIAANGGAGHLERHRHLLSALLYEALRETVRKK